MDGHIIAGAKKGCYLINSSSAIKIVSYGKSEIKTWFGLGRKTIDTVYEVVMNKDDIDNYIIDYKLVSSKRAPSPVRGAITGRTLFGRTGAKIGLIAGMLEESLHMGKQVEISWIDNTTSLVEMNEELYETLVRFMYDVQYKKTEIYNKVIEHVCNDCDMFNECSLTTTEEIFQCFYNISEHDKYIMENARKGDIFELSDGRKIKKTEETDKPEQNKLQMESNNLTPKETYKDIKDKSEETVNINKSNPHQNSDNNEWIFI